MAVSTNLGLYLPTREDYISVQRDLSDNYEIIDESAGMLEKGIAIVVNGDTAPQAISSGDYLFIKNHSTLATGGYHATANIANGAAVTSSNTASDDKGVANTIKGDIDALNSKIDNKPTIKRLGELTGNATSKLSFSGTVYFLLILYTTSSNRTGVALCLGRSTSCIVTPIGDLGSGLTVTAGTGQISITPNGSCYCSVMQISGDIDDITLGS